MMQMNFPVLSPPPADLALQVAREYLCRPETLHAIARALTDGECGHLAPDVTGAGQWQPIRTYHFATDADLPGDANWSYAGDGLWRGANGEEARVAGRLFALDVQLGSLDPSAVHDGGFPMVIATDASVTEADAAVFAAKGAVLVRLGEGYTEALREREDALKSPVAELATV